MRSTSSLYKVIKTSITSWYDVRIIQGVNIYGIDKIMSLSVFPSLTSGSGINIGNANSAECDVTLMEASANWERMAQFTVQFRICNTESNVASEWITFGTFYTDERSEDKYGNLSIVAYDGMLKLEQSWTDKIPEEMLPASWPITAKAWATMIQSAELATFADLTQLDDTVAFVGLDTSTTIRDVLKSIAAVHAGNWMMATTTENSTIVEKLKLMPFVNVDIETATTDMYIDLALSMVTFNDSPALSPVSGVHLETDGGTVMEAGDDTGYVVKANCSVSSTTGVAALCLSKIEGYVYKPFTTYTAHLDPIAEPGDSVAIDGVMYQMMAMNWIFSKAPIADIAAPYDQEIDHEYTIPSEQAKNYRKAMAAVAEQMSEYVPWSESSTVISQNETQISLIAESTCVSQDVFDETIAEIQNQLDGNIQSWSGNAVPTLNNAPAVDWTTPTLKNEHVGDMYFINSDAGIPEAGSYYRFENNNGVYSWQLITDSLATEALAKAAAALAAADAAQDTADTAEAEVQLKGRIFVVQPTPPYNVGDLWFDSDQSEILTCMTARESGGFASGDWVKRNKYTDDSAFAAFQTAYNETIAAIQEQIDQKAETYYQDYDPMVDWDATIAGIAIAGINVVGFDGEIGMTHKGDLWYRTTDDTTWFWDGTQWIQQNVPDDVFDKIDGKAQVFVNTPYTPYNVGDLWFNSDASEIMTCVVARATGDFVQDDWEKRNKYTDDTAANQVLQELNSFVSAVYTPEIAALQADIDGKIDTWFYEYEPTLENYPASEWVSTYTQNEHVDDLFYDLDTGYTYRFSESNGTYSWERIKDEDIVSAMQAASMAQDTADGKRKVFITKPTDSNDYDVGDLWVNATVAPNYNNDILRCVKKKASGSPYNISHWTLASKYTDDSALEAFAAIINPEIASIQADLDGKIDTWFFSHTPTLLNAPAKDWNTDTLRAEHVNDLFYCTASGYTYQFTGSGSVYSWERIKDSDITTAMDTASQAQDTADGKRRVFVSQPTTAQEYDVGDLWVNATYGSTYSNDLLRCKTAKASGVNFSISHWELASKYTDDTAAQEVAQALTTFESSFTVEPSQISAEINKHVVKDQQSTKTTFGWLMNDTSHTWYANNQEVMKVQQSGLSVKGSITATSGYIGNGSSGFTINNTEFHNGMTSMSDTTHNGVYIGTNGIALGKGKFKVTSAGSVTASDLTVTGGSIKIGGTSQSPTFYVDASGNLYAQSGTFAGNVYASNIAYGGDYGTLAGAAVTPGTIYGGDVYGQIAQATLGDYNIAHVGNYGAITPASFSEGVQASLTNADIFGLATATNPTDFPARFKAGYITAANTMTARDFTVSPESGSEITLSNHYHSVTVNDQTGVVTFGRPYNTTTPPSFNIADTHAYRDAVSAVTVTSLDLEYTYDDEMHIYRLMGYAKNQAGTVVYQSTAGQWNTDRSAYVDGKADGAAEVTVNTVTQYSYSSTGDKSVTLENAYVRYNNGNIIGRVQIALNGNSNTATCVVSMDGQRAYQSGQGSVSSTVQGWTISASDYGDYTQAINFGSSSLYTASGMTYGKIKVSLNNGTAEKIVRIGMPAGSSTNISSFTVEPHSDTTSDFVTTEDQIFWRTNVYAKDANNTVVASDTTGNVLCDISTAMNFAYEAYSPSSGSILSTSSQQDLDDYNYSGYIQNYLYTSGSSKYARIALKNSKNQTIYKVRVQMDAGGDNPEVDNIYAILTGVQGSSSTPSNYPYGLEWDGSNHYIWMNMYARNGNTTLYMERNYRLQCSNIISSAYNLGWEKGYADGGGGSAGTPIQLKCTSKTSGSGIAKTWTFQITSTTDYPFVAGQSYNFYY